MGLPLLLLKFVDEFDECTFIEGVPLSSVEEVFARFPCGDCNLPTNEIFDCPVSRGKTGEIGSLTIPADGMLGDRSRETSLFVIFYGEPIQNSTVQSPVTLFFLHGVNTCKGVPAGQLL